MCIRGLEQGGAKGYGEESETGDPGRAGLLLSFYFAGQAVVIYAISSVLKFGISHC